MVSNNPEPIIPRQITRIFGEFYDVTNFDHPGGATALSLCIGRDATELFHSCHQLGDEKKVKAMLNKLKTIPTDEEMKRIPDNGIFDWKATLESPFYKDLRELCDPIFAKHGTKQNWYRTFEIGVMFALFIWQYTYFIAGYWHSVVTMPFFLWLFIVSTSHDGSHFAVSKTPWINDLCAEFSDFNQTITYWYHEHVIGHHCFTQVFKKDPDCQYYKGFRLHIDAPVRPMHRYQHIIYPLIFFIRHPITHFKNMMALMTIKRGGFYGLFPMIPLTMVDHSINMLRIGIMILVMYGLPLIYHGFTWKGFIFAYVPNGLFSLHFWICSGFNHQHVDIDDRSSQNFYIHQIVSSQNIDCTGWNYWVFLYTGGLSHQIEHHLFPTMNHTHLWRIQPIVQRLCKKYDIPYQMAPTFMDAVFETFAHMKKLSGVLKPSK